MRNARDRSSLFCHEYLASRAEYFFGFIFVFVRPQPCGIVLPSLLAPFGHSTRNITENIPSHLFAPLDLSSFSDYFEYFPSTVSLSKSSLGIQRLSPVITSEMELLRSSSFNYCSLNHERFIFKGNHPQRRIKEFRKRHFLLRIIKHLFFLLQSIYLEFNDDLLLSAFVRHFISVCWFIGNKWWQRHQRVCEANSTSTGKHMVLAFNLWLFVHLPGQPLLVINIAVRIIFLFGYQDWHQGDRLKPYVLSLKYDGVRFVR